MNNKNLHNRISSIISKNGYEIGIHRHGYWCSEPGYIRALYFNNAFIKLVGGSHQVKIYINTEGMFNKNLENCSITCGDSFSFDSDPYSFIEPTYEFIKFIEIMEEYFDEENKNNYTQDWRIGKYYIHKSYSGKFEVIQYKSCGDGSHALVGTAETYDKAFDILEKRNSLYKDKLLEKRIIDDVEYFHYG